MRARPPIHPGGILKRHYLEPLNLTISELAKSLGVSRKTLSGIVNEHGVASIKGIQYNTSTMAEFTAKLRFMARVPKISGMENG